MIFSPSEREIRRQVWRSLFILDRFVAISLGRPIAIAQEDCSGDALDPPLDSPDPTPSDWKDINTGLEAGVRGCHFMTIVLKKIYQRRRVSTKVARELGDLCKKWPRSLPRSLHWRRATPNDRRQAMAILHVNTLYCYSILLFTRPYFVYLLSKEMQRIYLGSTRHQQRAHRKMEKYSEACIIAALHMIALLQNAYDGGYLPQRDPFAIHFLFFAALVVLSGRFVARTTHAASEHSIQNATVLLAYCAQTDPQAAKESQIYDDFKKIIFGEDSHQPQPPASVPENTQTSSSMPSFTHHRAHPSEQASSYRSYSDARPSVPGSGSQVFSNTVEPMLPIPSASPGGGGWNLGEATTSAFNLPLLPQSSLSNDSLSGLLESEDTIFTTNSEDSSQVADEQINFDKLWQWPGCQSPSLDTPEFQSMGIQNITNSAVPMFETLDVTEQY